MASIHWKTKENNRALLGDNPTPIFAKSIMTPEELTYEEFQVASAFVLNFLGVWEDRYLLYKAGLLSDEDWKHFVDEKLPDVDTDATYQWWLDTREGLSTNPQE